MENAVLVAKMSMNMLTEQHHQDGKTAEVLQLGAVYGKEGTANAQWSKFTPSGQLNLTVNNPAAFGKVKPGYYKVFLVPCGEND